MYQLLVRCLLFILCHTTFAKEIINSILERKLSNICVPGNKVIYDNTSYVCICCAKKIA